MARIVRIDNDGSWVYVQSFSIRDEGSYNMCITWDQAEAEEMSWVRAMTICAYLKSESGLIAEPTKKKLEEVAVLD